MIAFLPQPTTMAHWTLSRIAFDGCGLPKPYWRRCLGAGAPLGIGARFHSRLLTLPLGERSPSEQQPLSQPCQEPAWQKSEPSAGGFCVPGLQ